MKYGAVWYEQVDNVFNIKNYLESEFSEFKVDLRLKEAQGELERMRRADEGATRFPSEAAAIRWIERVEQWGANLRADLEADSVAAAGCPGERWLLYGCITGSDATSTGDSIRCYLCKGAWRRCVAEAGRARLLQSRCRRTLVRITSGVAHSRRY